MGGWAKFLMGLNLLLLTGVVAVFGYDAWLAHEQRGELTQERVGEMIAQGVEERLSQYSNESADQGKSAVVAQPLSNEELRETIKASIEAALAAKPPSNPATESAEGALQAASSFSIELGARTQELLERLTDQAASIAKIEVALPDNKTAATASAKPGVEASPARVTGSAVDSSSASSPVALSQTKISDAALMARVIEGINAAPPTAAGPVARAVRERTTIRMPAPTPVTVALRKTESIEPLAPGNTRRLTEVHFSPSSTDLSPGAQRKTREAADELKLLDARKVRVIGFTDTVGSRAENDKLARKRARNVAKMLASLGVPADRIEIVGRGESGGPQSTLDNVDEPLNRCVGIIAVK